MFISSLPALRALYPEPTERARRKEITALDVHCRRFIELSPFVLLATSDAHHQLDASPRGGSPGFVKITETGDLLIPDAPGNNRLDSLENIVTTGSVGLLFLIPGVDETLRVNGDAVLSHDPQDIASCTDERRAPTLVIRVVVRAAYVHCAKALMRSQLWSASSQIDRRTLPTIGEMLNDQTGITTPPETREAMVARYTPEL